MLDLYDNILINHLYGIQSDILLGRYEIPNTPIEFNTYKPKPYNNLREESIVWGLINQCSYLNIICSNLCESNTEHMTKSIPSMIKMVEDLKEDRYIQAAKRILRVFHNKMKSKLKTKQKNRIIQIRLQTIELLKL